MKNSEILKFALIGLGLGMCYPIALLLFDQSNTQAWSLNSIASNPSHLISFTAPIILGSTFSWLGIMKIKQKSLNRFLQLKNVQLKKNVELMDSFTFHVSHDLKSTLSYQIGLSNLIFEYLQAGDVDKAKEMLSLIVEVSKNGVDMVHNLLEISKETYVTPDSSMEEINAVQVANRMTTSLKLSDDLKVKYGRIEFFNLNIQEKIWESILMNLFTNAIKYSRSTPMVKLEFITKRDAKVITVEDFGIGIDLDKHKESLFEPFCRINNNSKAEGTGLGLFIVKKLVQANGGTISAESQLGLGTKFTLSFPVLTQSKTRLKSLVN